MIKERDTKVYRYDPSQDIRDANLVLEDFGGADGGFNSFRAKRIIECLSTKLDPETEAMVMDGFHKILLEEETEWYVFAIQPLPGMLRIRLHHSGAQIVDDYGENEVDDEMTAERKAECKRIKAALDGCEADLVLSWKKSPPRGTQVWFSLTLKSGESVGFEVNENETTVEVSRGLFEGSIEYVLAWKNPKHTHFEVRRTHEFCL